MTVATIAADDEFADWWVCACVKRDKAGRMKAIKRHSPQTKRCRVCGCSKSDVTPTAKPARPKAS